MIVFLVKSSYDFLKMNYHSPWRSQTWYKEYKVKQTKKQKIKIIPQMLVSFSSELTVETDLKYSK